MIGNAVQAMADGRKRELTIFTGSDGDNAVRVTVADTGTGTGLAADMTDRLFQIFATTKARGLGLGFSTCRINVEENGGHIWATPRPGGSAACHFTLTCGPGKIVQ